MSVLQVALEPSTLVVAVDPGKVTNRVWVSDGSGLLTGPVSLPVSREGIACVEGLVTVHGRDSAARVFAIETTGSLHRAWAHELERRHPGQVRLFAPSETKAARVQLGSGRFKTDDRDCAALTYLVRQGAGRLVVDELEVETLRAVVRHRRGLVADRKGRPAAPPRPAQRSGPGTVRTSRTRPQPRGRADIRTGGSGLCCRIRRSPTRGALPAGQSTGTLDQGRCPVLGGPVARLPATAS
jgi:hypothetical protein